MSESLEYLETMGFISLVQTQPDLEYEFKHTLIQDVVYQTLLKREKQQLHLAVGNVLEYYFQERMEHGHFEQVAPVLAEHFLIGGELSRALKYFRQAAQAAADHYAIPEAISFFSKAIEIAEKLSEAVGPMLMARGQLVDILGDVYRAHADLEAAIKAAHRENNQRLEIQALVSLGLVWAAQDYARTGEYCHKALFLARELGDPVELAHTLNRVGNFSMNILQVDEAIQYHQEALKIFEGENDLAGIASTVDLLGMSQGVKGDFVAAVSHLNRAVDLFTQTGNLQGLATAYITRGVGCALYQSDTMVPVTETVQESVDSVQKGLDICRSMHWRSGEAFALSTMGECFAAQARFDLALKNAHQSLDIATNIQHFQWMVGANFILGNIYLDLFSYKQAESYLENGLDLARKIRSVYWEKVTIPSISLVYIHQGRYKMAQELLDEALPEDAPAGQLYQRMIWTARAALALAQRDLEGASQIIKHVTAETPSTFPGKVPLRVSLLAGNILAASGNYEESQVELQKGSTFSATHGAHNYLWQFQAALSRVYHAMGLEQKMIAEKEQALKRIEEIAISLPGESLKVEFLRGAQAMFPLK